MQRSKPRPSEQAKKISWHKLEGGEESLTEGGSDPLHQTLPSQIGPVPAPSRADSITLPRSHVSPSCPHATLALRTPWAPNQLSSQTVPHGSDSFNRTSTRPHVPTLSPSRTIFVQLVLVSSNRRRNGPAPGGDGVVDKEVEVSPAHVGEMRGIGFGMQGFFLRI